MDAGRLKHRIIIEELEDIADSDGEVQDSFGAPMRGWQTVATVWASIEPLSGREFITAQSEQSKIVAKITIRTSTIINASMRIYHSSADKFYNIEAILADKDSGKEYQTIMVSEGTRFKNSAES